MIYFVNTDDYSVYNIIITKVEMLNIVKRSDISLKLTTNKKNGNRFYS